MESLKVSFDNNIVYNMRKKNDLTLVYRKRRFNFKERSIFNIKKLFKNQPSELLLTKIVLLTITFYFFILVDLSFFSLVSRIYIIISIIDYLFWLIFIHSVLGLFIIGILKSRFFRFFYSLFILLASGFFFIVSIIIYPYSQLGFVFLIILLSITCFYFIFLKIHSIFPKKIKNLILLGIIISISIISFFTFYEFLFITELLLLDFFLSSSASTLLSSKFIFTRFFPKNKILHKKQKKMNFFLKIMLIIIPLVSCSALFIPMRAIMIKPHTNSEIYFYTSAGAIPNDNATLEKCRENGIGFAVSLTRKAIKEGDYTERKKIQKLVDHSINFYIVIGGDDRYFATIENGDKFNNIYEDIRAWLVNNIEYIGVNVYHSVFFKGFMLDAEPHMEDIEDTTVVEKYHYFFNEIPEEERINKVQESLESFFDKVKNDNKEIGMIRPFSSYDHLDNDYDYSLLQKTLNSLPLKWDFSVTMTYRTRHKPDNLDYLILNVKDYAYFGDPTDNQDLEKKILPLATYYTKVMFELNCDEINIEEDNRYIFIGTFHDDFEDTSYIKDNGFLKDIDILRHLERDKIFIYDWDNFKGTYEDGLDLLIEHLKQEDEWLMSYPSYILSREIAVMIFIMCVDRFIYL